MVGRGGRVPGAAKPQAYISGGRNKYRQGALRKICMKLRAQLGLARIPVGLEKTGVSCGPLGSRGSPAPSFLLCSGVSQPGRHVNKGSPCPCALAPDLLHSLLPLKRAKGSVPEEESPSLYPVPPPPHLRPSEFCVPTFIQNVR